MAIMLRGERVRRGWTLEYVSARLGLTVSAVRKIETGKRYPSYPVLLKLEDLFQRPHRELFAKAPDGQCLAGSLERPTR